MLYSGSSMSNEMSAKRGLFCVFCQAKGAQGVDCSNNLHAMKTEIEYGIKTYCLQYCFNSENNLGRTDTWTDRLHFLQLWFGVKDFLIISPKSMSGVVLDAPEATKLLSAVAIALSNCGSELPIFVPVHDPTRKAYKGIQHMQTLYSRSFEADRIGSQVPVKLMHLEGLYELFVSKLVPMLSDFSNPSIQVHYTMRLTYKTISAGSENEQTEGPEFGIAQADIIAEDNPFKQTQWDDEFPWSEWYSAEDPIKGFELLTLWHGKLVESSVEMAELENASAFEADKWFLSPLSICPRLDSSTKGSVCFTTRLAALVEAYYISFEAHFIDDFISAEKSHIQKITRSAIIPPPTVLDRILKDLFQEGPILNMSRDVHESAHCIKGAPINSLFTQFCLHSLWFGTCNIRAIALLWTEFVREVRWCWEELQPLPRMPNDGNIDLSSCLIHQKLHMLALCINKKALECQKDQNEDKHSNIADDIKRDNAYGFQLDRKKETGNQPKDLLHNERGRMLSENESLHHARRGSLGPAENLMLLKTFERLHVPLTQDIPVMTQDMHEERQHAIESFSNSIEGKNIHAQLEKEILASDMSAFKAANPGSVFEDFIRWHSPGDWIEDYIDEINRVHGSHGASSITEIDQWPPKGQLSKRMSEPGNSWRQIWDSVEAVPASEQKPLLDPEREGEKVLHYLETLRPHQLVGQMICTSFRGSLELLSTTSYGGFKHLATKIEELYQALASSLKPLQDEEILEDLDDVHSALNNVCSFFRETEELIVLAASLHKKLQHCPRLEARIFSDHMKFVQNMKQSSKEAVYTKQFVRAHERTSVSELFPSPSPRQSWRKVLTMGNKLNGHEPLSREVIFSFDGNMSSKTYGGLYCSKSHSSLRTHSMYICGTSNDLQVALASTHSD